MLRKKTSLTVTIRLLLFCCLCPLWSVAQTYTLSGKINDTAGHAVPSATVSAKSIATGKTFTAESASDGTYSIHDLVGGEYEVSAVAGELQAPAIKVTLAAAQSTDLTVSPSAKSVESTPDAAGAATNSSTLFQCSIAIRSRIHPPADTGQYTVTGNACPAYGNAQNSPAPWINYGHSHGRRCHHGTDGQGQR